MNKAAFKSGLLAIGGMLFIKALLFYDGFRFTFSIFLLPILLLVILLGALWFCVSGGKVLIAVCRGLASPRTLLLFFGIFLIMVSTPLALNHTPSPQFAGMAARLKWCYTEDELMRIAALAKTLSIDWNKSSDDEKYKDKLRIIIREHPCVQRLSNIEPRFMVKDKFVDIFWGGALCGHWGIRILDRDTTESELLKGRYASERVFSHVWVYMTPN